MLDLMPHQRDGIEWLRRTPRALLADDPGLGKSAQALLAAEEPVLIVAPAMLEGTWCDEKTGEIAKWRPDLDYSWVSYSSFCHREGRRVEPRPKAMYANEEWGTIICDEAHYLKNRKAKWTQAMLSLVKNNQGARLMLLTGTPIPNWGHELFMPLRLLHDADDRSYTSYWRWIDDWFTWWTPPWARDNNHREIGGVRSDIGWDVFAAENDLGEFMIRRLRDEVLKDLPPLTEQTVLVPMEKTQRRAYDELVRDYFTYVEESDTEVAAFSDGGLHVKLAKVTTGTATLAEEVGLFGSCKLDALRELLEEREGAPVVVFCHFRATARCIELLGQTLGRSVGVIMGGVPQKRRDEMVNQFQSGVLDMLVGTLETLGEGVTLTRSSTCIFVERSWRPSKNEQAMRRLHRIGQTAPVTVIHIVTEKSLDQRILALLAAKERQQMQALTAAEFARLL
jgi:SNF2 family DNA or RNA helicase